MKLIIQEEESEPLIKFLNQPITSSLISRLEVLRNVYRLDANLSDFAISVLGRIVFLPISASTIRIAESVARLTPLKSLDALHVASALSIAQKIEGIISYDRQLSLNAEQLGLKVFSPA
jgi:predicted nucleic acid-binding protein